MRARQFITAAGAAVQPPHEAFHFTPSDAKLGNVIGMVPHNEGFRLFAVQEDKKSLGILESSNGLEYQDVFTRVPGFPSADVVGGSVSTFPAMGGRWKYGGIFTVLEISYLMAANMTSGQTVATFLNITSPLLISTPLPSPITKVTPTSLVGREAQDESLMPHASINQILFGCPLTVTGEVTCDTGAHTYPLLTNGGEYVDLTTLIVPNDDGLDSTALVFLHKNCTLTGMKWGDFAWEPMPGWDSINSSNDNESHFDRCDSITVAQHVESRSNLEWRDVVVISGEKKGRSHTELAIGLFKSAAGGESLRFLTAGFLATGLGATNFNLATVGRGSHAIATGVYTVPDGTRKLTVGRHLKLVGDKPHVNPVPSLDNSLEQSLEPFPISGIGSALSRECEWQSVDGGRSVAVDLRFDGAWGGSDVEINFERESIEGPLFKSTVSLDVRATAVKILIDGKVHEHEMALSLDASRVFAVFDPEVLELFVTNKTLVVPVLRPAAITQICVRQISGRSLKLGADSAYYVLGKARVPSAATSIQTGLITILLLAATIIFI